MKLSLVAVIALASFSAHLAAQNTLFTFDNVPAHSGLPITVTSGGITATLTGTNQGFSVQTADVLGFTPAGFSGNCIYPDSVFAADLQIQFVQNIKDFSIMYAPEEYACDSSATMRATAYWNGAYVGSATTTAPNPGTWPTGTLRFTSTRPFNYVVVHYDSAPPTGGDWGPVFMADNMLVTLDTAPYAINDRYSTTVNSTLNVASANGVLANDLFAAGSLAVETSAPAHGTLTLSSNGSFLYLPDLNFCGTDAFTYEDSLNGQVSNHATVVILVQPPLISLAVADPTVLGGQATQGTVTLGIPAPVGGTAVSLGVNTSVVSVPASITVPVGFKTASFQVKTSQVTSAGVWTVTATLNNAKKTASVLLYPLSPLSSLTAKPNVVVGGAPVSATVTLAKPVPSDFEIITLTRGSTLITLPASVKISPPNQAATFTVSTVAVSATTVVAFSAALNGVKRTETITLTTPPIVDLSFALQTLKGGTGTTATITLGGKAGPSGDTVYLKSANVNVVVPLSVRVLPGTTSITFPVLTKAVTTNTSVPITASLGAATRTTILTVTP